jgi:peroxiredoxin
MSGATIWRNVILLVWGVLVFVLDPFIHTNEQMAGNSQARGKNYHDAVGKRALIISASPTFWTNLQKIAWFIVVIFLTTEVILFSGQNRELKKRLAMLVGEGKNASLMPGEVVQPFKATGLDGKDKAITYNGESAKTLLLIFSTACGACERNLLNWSEIASKLQGGSCRVVGISVDPLDKTKNYVLAKSMNYPILVATDRTFKQSYKIFFTPQTILVDSHGEVEKVWAGALDSLQVEEVINKLTKPPKPFFSEPLSN